MRDPGHRPHHSWPPSRPPATARAGPRGLLPALGPLLHWLEIALACIGLAAAVTVGLTVRRRWRQRQALPQGRYVPWLQPQPQRQQFPA
jgi:hypothetical protein